MKTITIMIRGIAVTALTTLVGCTAPSAFNSNETAVGAQSNLQFMQAKISLSVQDGQGSTIYSDSVANSSLVLKSNTTYQLVLNVSGAPAGTTFSAVVTNIDQIGATGIPVPLQAGSNTFSVATQGDYTIKLIASAAGYNPQTKSYNAQVTCPNPTFTANSLTSSAISVTGMQNNYNFSAIGVTADANGMAPYVCAWDPTGTGIMDTAFVDCNTVLNNVYGNYVSTRNIGLVVRDSCNISQTISASENLAFTDPTPTSPGNTYIYGVVSNASGQASSDSRVNNVTYLATDTANNKILQVQNGSGTFAISAWQNYHMGSSVNFGMQIKVTGIGDSAINLQTLAGTGPLDTSNARISSITYTTDQAGDQLPSVSFVGSSCTSTINAKALVVQGQPCTGGTSGDQNNATVEVWGTYDCTGLTGPEGSIEIKGSFDGYYDIADSCSGGGQGGGGVPPPGF